MKDTLAARYQCRCMMTWLDVLPSRFDSVKVYFEIMEELVEDSDGVASAPNAGDHSPGELVFSRAALVSSLLSDDALEVADYGREWEVSHDGPQHPVGVRSLG